MDLAALDCRAASTLEKFIGGGEREREGGGEGGGKERERERDALEGMELRNAQHSETCFCWTGVQNIQNSYDETTNYCPGEERAGSYTCPSLKIPKE